MNIATAMLTTYYVPGTVLNDHLQYSITPTHGTEELWADTDTLKSTA